MSFKLFKDFSTNGVQVVLNQLLGIAIFYITSMYLSKEVFGELNWSLATSSLFISAAGFGIDLIVVRKIAAGGPVRESAGLFIIHIIFTSSILIVLLLLCSLLIPSIYVMHMLLPGIMISQILSFFSSPYKQMMNGKRFFSRLAVLLTISNAIKFLLLILSLIFHFLTLRNVIFFYIAGSAAEFIAGILLLVKNRDTIILPLYWNFKKYSALVKESLPQFGVTVFNVVLARFDWFILGILTTAAITAEYSFAYRVFELTRLPLLIISPVLIPVFVRIFSENKVIDSSTVTKLKLLFRGEMILSIFLPLILVSCWTPLMDSISDHKYGSANEAVFWLLCVCVPIQFATDYYWNLCFAQNQLRLTFLIAIISSGVNVALNFILIPYYEAKGAAIAYIACFVVQLTLFRIYTRQDKIKPELLLLGKALFCAFISILVVKQVALNVFLAVPAALSIYIVLGMAIGLILPGKIRPIIASLSKGYKL